MINGFNVFSEYINLPRMLLVNKILFVGLKVTKSISFQVYPFLWTEAHWILIFLGHLKKHFYSYIFIYLLIKHMIEHMQYCFLLQLQFFCRPFLINFFFFLFFLSKGQCKEENNILTNFYIPLLLTFWIIWLLLLIIFYFLLFVIFIIKYK